MPRLSLWNSKKRNDYQFFDRVIAEQFSVGGTSFLIHKYEGVPEQSGVGDDLTQSGGTGPNVIQDLLFLENRDRKYSDDIYELRGSYNVQDNDFDLSQFGLFLTADVLYVEFHINSMVDILGRKLITGDVLEVPHQRDDLLLDGEDDGLSSSGPARKFYVVEDASRASSGYSPTWYPHIWRIKMKPIDDSQEFDDILSRDVSAFDDNPGAEEVGESLRDMISTFNTNIDINNAIVAEAERQVPFRNLEHAHLYVMEGQEDCPPYAYLSDGEPPNGAKLLGCGPAFPLDSVDGDWFLRTDYKPSVLFQRCGSGWTRKEIDYKQKLTTANRVLNDFISNREQTPTSEGLVDTKQGLSQVLKPKVRPINKINPDYT